MDTFVPIPDFPDYYINRNGEILSKTLKKDRLLKPGLNSNGYYHVCLYKDKKRKSMKVHRLLALMFIPNPDNLPFVDHHDRIRTNNSLVNLSWVTRATNQQNATRRKDNKTGHKNIHFYVDKRRNNDEWYIIDITRNGKRHKKRFKTLEEAIKYRNKYLTALGEEIID